MMECDEGMAGHNSDGRIRKWKDNGRNVRWKACGLGEENMCTCSVEGDGKTGAGFASRVSGVDPKQVWHTPTPLACAIAFPLRQRPQPAPSLSRCANASRLRQRAMQHQSIQPCGPQQPKQDGKDAEEVIAQQGDEVITRADLARICDRLDELEDKITKTNEVVVQLLHIARPL